MSTNQTVILGAGITGLSAGHASELPIYEASPIPGGICTSYYMRPGQRERMYKPPSDQEAYHFEIGGGHWIFGGDPTIVHFITKHAPSIRYNRKASIYLRGQRIFVPYPIQNNLSCLDKVTAHKAANEIMHGVPVSRVDQPLTMAEWMKINFGPTLCSLFFDPFHELYTAGQYRMIAPQDDHKTPIDRSKILQGLMGETTPTGYNTTFIYPQEGLNSLIDDLARSCHIHHGKQVEKIDAESKTIQFTDGSNLSYDKIISTLPLNIMMRMTRLSTKQRPDPVSSVLVLNIGAEKGPRYPDYHWIYTPDTMTGFHRVGFYSNVNPMFLPKGKREKQGHSSVYVEKAYPEGALPAPEDMERFCLDAIRELQELGWIGNVDVYDPTWIETAYTWKVPGSNWQPDSLKLLESKDIFQMGRYARWTFQGIADSIKDGLVIGSVFRK